MSILSRRRAVAWLPVVLGLTGCSGDDGDETGGEAPAVAGYWLWSEHVEDGQVVRTITDADMSVAVGSSGWPDCPDGILCTRWGIQKIELDASGVAHFIHNVHTSSDFHHKGSYAAAGDLLAFSFLEYFSCAHPDQSTLEDEQGYSRWKLEEGRLWLSVRAFDSSSPFADAPPDAPTRWVVFRPISFQQFDETYAIRLCQASSPDDCHADCFPERYGTSF